MGKGEIIISRVGVEEPNLHTISINGVLSIVAIELELVVLLGSSINSVNSEYRQFNLDTRVISKVFKLNTDNRQINSFFGSIMKKLTKDVVKIGKTEIKNVAYQGLNYAVIYYLLIKRFKYTEEYFVNLNAFTTIVPMVKLFDKLFINTSMAGLKAFTDYILEYDHLKYQIGSKVLCLTRNQVDNTTDLSQTIWKTQYITRILKTIPTSQSYHFFSPAIDWCLIQCVTRHVFTNENLVNKVAFGENINYIRSSAKKQNQMASEIISGHLQKNALESLKKLTIELKQSTESIDYALGDIAIVLFYENKGATIFNEISMFIEESKLSESISNKGLAYSILSDSEWFKELMFQYLYATFILTKQGIIHNDAHLNNILISKNTAPTNRAQEYQLSPGNIISMKPSGAHLTIIDFDKSILSHHHHNYFNKTANAINEEMGIVFDTTKKTIVDDFNQVFNCYALYDIIKFSLNMKHLLTDVEQIVGPLLSITILKSHQKFLDKMIKLSTDVLYQIYEPIPKLSFDYTRLGASMEWLIMEIFGSYSKSSKTKSSMLRSTRIIDVHSSFSAEKPGFISSRRKYTETLKTEFIARYASK